MKTTKAEIRKVMSYLGSRTSERKAQSSRENGKKNKGKRLDKSVIHKRNDKDAGQPNC